MYKRRRNSLVGVLSLVVVTALGSGCSGSSDTKSFTLAVPAEVTPQELFQSAMTRAVDLCVADPKLVAVSWTFSKQDADNPIVVEYQETPYHQRQPCDAIRASVEQGILTVDPTSTTTGK